MRSLRLVAIPIVFGTLWATAGSARAATCSLSGSDLLIQLAAETITVRGTGGMISVNGIDCAQSASVAAATITGADGSNERVSLRLGSFPEAAGISWTVALGTGDGDWVTIRATAAGSRISVGTLPDSSEAVDLDADRESDLDATGVDNWRLEGQAGNDRLAGRVVLTSGTFVLADRLHAYGGAGDDILLGGKFRDTMYGEDGNDELYGGQEMDGLLGGPGDDYIEGGPQFDSITGGPGDDTLLGGSGYDYFAADPQFDGDDYIDGGGDIFDFVTYAGRTADITVDLAAGVGGQAGESDTLVGIEKASGGSGNDTLIGSDVRNVLNGGAGDDTLIGAGAVDTLSCGSGIDSWSDSLDRPFDCENPL